MSACKGCDKGWPLHGRFHHRPRGSSLLECANLAPLITMQFTHDEHGMLLGILGPKLREAGQRYGDSTTAAERAFYSGVCDLFRAIIAKFENTDPRFDDTSEDPEPDEDEDEDEDDASKSVSSP